MRPLAFALLLACGHPAALREPQGRAPFCFALQVQHDGPEYALACTETLPLCVYVRDRAIAWAGIAAFEQIGQCRGGMR